MQTHIINNDRNIAEIKCNSLFQERHVLVYNTENTLTGMFVYRGSTLTYEAHYVYDPLGRRIEKRETDHTGGKTIIEQYVYRDEDIVFRIIVDPNTGERAVNQVYTHGELAVDDPVAFPDCPNAVCLSGGWAFPGKDQVQSVETIFTPDTHQSLNLHYSVSGISSKEFFYEYNSGGGKRYGITYHRNRYYDSIVDIFVYKNIFDTYDYSPYAYALNNSLIYVEPLGLYSFIQKGKEREKSLIRNAMRILKKMYNTKEKPWCKNEFEKRGIDINEMVGKNSGKPLYIMFRKAGKQGEGRCVGIGWSDNVPYICINPECLPPKKTPCELASLLMHEFIHIEREDKEDVEDKDFQKKCSIGSCINPGRFH